MGIPILAEVNPLRQSGGYSVETGPVPARVRPGFLRQGDTRFFFFVHAGRKVTKKEQAAAPPRLL